MSKFLVFAQRLTVENYAELRTSIFAKLEQNQAAQAISKEFERILNLRRKTEKIEHKYSF